MPSNNIRYCLLIRDPLQNNGESQLRSIHAIQAMPEDLQEKWVEAIIKEVGFNSADEDEESVSLQSIILNPDGTIEIKNDSANPDTEIYLAHYQPLTEVIDALKSNEQTKDLPAYGLASFDASENFNRAVTLRLLSQANFADDTIGFRNTLGGLKYGCIKFTAELQNLSKSISPRPNHWMAVNPKQSFATNQYSRSS